MPLMLSLSSGIASGDVSATVSRSSAEPSRLSKKSLPAARVTRMSHEYTDRGVHISVVSSESVMNTCAASSFAYCLLEATSRDVNKLSDTGTHS